MNIEARTTDFSADQGTSARQLAAAAEPVFIFDGKMPVLVWANAPALSFVGHSSGPGAQLPQFDRSMPAMARLRDIAEQELSESGVRTELVFWTPSGARTLACTCRRATFAFAPEALIVHGAVEDVAGAVIARSEQSTKAKRKAGAKTPAAAKEPVKVGERSRQVKGKARNGKIKSRKDLRTRRGRGVAPAGRPQAADSAGAPGSLPVEDGHTIALREIARQIQSATDTRHINGGVFSDTPMQFDSDGRSTVITAAASVTATRELDVEPEIAPTQDALAAPLSRHNPDFLSHVGHEIRTPLNSILGFAEIMREERFGPVGNARYKSYASDIHDSATHALTLINDLLDLSRVEAGGLQLDLVELDVAGVTAQAVASLLPVAEKAGVMLSAPAGRPLPKLVCDLRSLKQMLLNLLSNAIKNTDPGGAVWLTAAIADDGGLVVRVQDTGIGMRAEDIALALEPYRQVGPAERHAGGTGLGLPLTKAMADANGGKLQLERIAGGGLAALLIFPPDKVVRH